MTTQLGLDGAETAHPVRQPRPLSPQQREVLAFIHDMHSVHPVEVSRRFRCVGFNVLLRLRRRGLVERVGHGVYRLVRHEEAW